jgi:hypothetical protein
LSIRSGFWHNAILNIIVMAGFALPLVASYRQVAPHAIDAG